MVFTTGSALLDAIVLAVVANEGTYGYKITQDVRAAEFLSNEWSNEDCELLENRLAMALLKLTNSNHECCDRCVVREILNVLSNLLDKLMK